jgi:hypothetical protein
MKKGLTVYLVCLLAVILLFVAVGCGAEGNAPDPTQPEVAVDSVESAYIKGQWEVNDGRFGHQFFDFGEDGRLLIEDADTGEVIEMNYLFVGENSFVLSGYEAFNGSATVNFFEDKMDLTITFEGNIFGELYLFSRVEDPSN